MNAKCRLLCLREMFIKYTDQNNYVSMERIQSCCLNCLKACAVFMKHRCSEEKSNRVKSDNEQTLDNIDAVNSAFRSNQQISFDYYDYDINKHLVQRGTKRLCSPFALVMSGECYYVVSYYEKYPDTYTNFRLDRMRNIELVNSVRKYPDEKLDLEQYIKSSFSMFSGKSEYVTLRLPLENKYCNIVIDRFGKSVLMLRDTQSDNHFMIHVPVKAEYPQPFFSWIFSFRGKIEIVSPIRLKERYTEVLYESCMQQYMN